ncbi:hypothetical protein Hanom_Chr14g01249731 [Helianthus anomalus]
MYTDGPCGLPKFWIWSLAFQKYMDGPCGLLNLLQSANHRDHPCTFGKSLGLNALRSANHRDHQCTFGKLGTKSKTLLNHRDHSCTLLFSLFTCLVG